jgi:N-methylhydantoinase B
MFEQRKQWEMEERGAEPKSVAATGEPPRHVHPTIVARDEGDERVLGCARCSHVITGYAGEFKRGLRVHRGPVMEIPGVDADPSRFLDDKVEFRRYCCPSCGVLMAADVARADEAPLPEMVLGAGA